MRSRTAMVLLMIAALAGGFAQEPASDAKSRTLLVLGDSLAAGYGVAPEEAFPGLLQERIRQEGLAFTVVNAGVSGDTSAGGLRRLNWLLRRPVDVLLLELGGNDGLRGIPPTATRNNLQRIITVTREKNPQVKVVIAGMRMPENLGREFAGEFHQVFHDLAATNRAMLIPFLLEGIAADPRFNLPDLIHPNARGHDVVASNVWQVLLPVLREVGGAPGPASAQSGDKAE